MVNPLKNKEVKPTQEIEIPELKVNGFFGKIISFFARVRHIYWLISFSVFLILLITFTPHQICTDFWCIIKAQQPLVGLVLIFSLVAVSLVWKFGQSIDVMVFMYLNMHGNRAPWLDWVMLGITQLGNFIFALAVSGILYFIGNHMLAYQLILGILTLGVAVELIKVLVHRDRPYIGLKNIRIVGSRESGRSFPSGHTSQAFFMTTLLLHFYQVNVFLWLLLYSMALLVGITRIYVGMHYPRDVLGGAVFGTMWALLGVIVNSYKF